MVSTCLTHGNRPTDWFHRPTLGEPTMVSIRETLRSTFLCHKICQHFLRSWCYGCPEFRDELGQNTFIKEELGKDLEFLRTTRSRTCLGTQFQLQAVLVVKKSSNMSRYAGRYSRLLSSILGLHPKKCAGYTLLPAVTKGCLMEVWGAHLPLT